MTPEELIELVRDGRREAEQEIVVYFRSRLLNFMQAKTGNPDLAQDLVQETLMAVVHAIRDGRLRQADNLVGYVLGAARNIANDEFRREARRKTVAIEDGMDFQQPERPLEDVLQKQQLQRAIAELAEDDQRILTMTLVEGCTSPEIASALSMRSDVVRQRKSRALKKLTGWLQTASQSGVEMRLLKEGDGRAKDRIVAATPSPETKDLWKPRNQA
jgi:RNA polymerase sigma factor (sigma-70 family)